MGRPRLGNELGRTRGSNPRLTGEVEIAEVGMTSLLTRRAFLGVLAASGIAAAASCTPSPGQGNGRSALVLGAGLAVPPPAESE